MNISLADVVTLIGSITAIIIALNGGRKVRADVVLAFEQAATDCGEHIQILQAALNNLQDDVRVEREKHEKAIKSLQQEIAGLSELLELKAQRIDELTGEIGALMSEIETLRSQLELKDTRIEELEKLTACQEQEINALRAEVEELRKTRRRS